MQENPSGTGNLMKLAGHASISQTLEHPLFPSKGLQTGCWCGGSRRRGVTGLFRSCALEVRAHQTIPGRANSPGRRATDLTACRKQVPPSLRPPLGGQAVSVYPSAPCGAKSQVPLFPEGAPLLPTLRGQGPSPATSCPSFPGGPVGRIPHPEALTGRPRSPRPALCPGCMTDHLGNFTNPETWARAPIHD